MSIDSSTSLLSRDGDDDSEDNDKRDMMYPHSMAWHLVYTSTLPFFSAAVALATRWYGLAILSFCLGVTSICWWWYPYRGSSWRTVDRACVLACAAYAWYVGFHIVGPWRRFWLIGLAIVSLTIITNELFGMYVRRSAYDDEYKETYMGYNLCIHALCAHVTLHVVASTLMVVYVLVDRHDAIRFKDTENAVLLAAHSFLARPTIH